jgi:hypothetical protein
MMVFVYTMLIFVFFQYRYTGYPEAIAGNRIFGLPVVIK